MSRVENEVQQVELKYICVEGLNGFLKHEVYLKEEGITILHGPNGCGKTTLLEMIIHFYKKDFYKLAKIDFKKLILVQNIIKDNNIESVTLTITKELYLNDNVDRKKVLKRKKDGRVFEYEIEEFLYKNDMSFCSLYYSASNSKNTGILLSLPISSDEKEMEYWWRNARNRILHSGRDIRQTSLFDEIEMMDEIDFYENKKYIATGRKNIPVINSFIESITFFMVKTQRLIYMPTDIDGNEKKNIGHLMINRYANDLAKVIGTALAESSEKTASHDKSFPERLISTIKLDYTVESEQDIRYRYKQTQDKITKILNAGLLFREKNITLPDDGLNNENIKTVLSLYLQDLNEKLSVYDDLLEKIEAFQEIVGKKIRNKDMRIHYEKGFYFTSKYSRPLAKVTTY